MGPVCEPDEWYFIFLSSPVNQATLEGFFMDEMERIEATTDHGNAEVFDFMKLYFNSVLW